MARTTTARSNTDTDAMPVRALEAHYYTDPAVFAAERKGLMARTWQYAGHVSALQKPGDYFCFAIAGENLFCIRDKAGDTRAFYNVCQHRAHELVRGSGQAKLLVCPYHAWTYDLDGRLRGGPNIAATPGFRRADICLTPVRIENFHGFLFANLDPDAASMDRWFPGAREEILEYVPDIARLSPLETIEVSERCNWKVSVENYSECYHCARNHPTFSSGVVMPESYDIRPQGYCLRHTARCQKPDSMSYGVDAMRNPRAGDYSSWFLWPMFSFQVYPGNILNTYQWLAQDTEQVLVRRGWYGHDGIDVEAIRRLALQDRETTTAEDVRLVESVQRGLASRGYRPGPLVIDPRFGVNSEHSLASLHMWMREGLAETGAGC